MLLYPINRRNVNNAGTTTCGGCRRGICEFHAQSAKFTAFECLSKSWWPFRRFLKRPACSTSIRFASQISCNMLFHCILMSFNAMSEFSGELQTASARSFKYSLSSSFSFYPRSFRALKHFYWPVVRSAIIKNKIENFIVLIQATRECSKKKNGKLFL